MAAGLLGRKIGMTRLFDASGKNLPVTVIEAGPCFVSQIKTVETDGYHAVQLAYGDKKPRNSTLPLIGHDAKAGLSAKWRHKEVPIEAGDAGKLELGQELTVAVFDGVKFVDITGVSKGKGFQGVMKRWNFKGQPASHGCERKHRSPGSIASRATNRGFSGRPKKGVRMAGHMGDRPTTLRSIEVVGFDKERHLLIVKGPIPGGKRSLVMIRAAKRLYKRKARVAKGVA
jgi:large subunit ribosomal protein L3